MYVNLACSKCGESETVSFASLYSLWKVQYDKSGKTAVAAYTEVVCHCGHRERYEGPMFKYIFQLIFDEFIKEETEV